MSSHHHKHHKSSHGESKGVQSARSIIAFLLFLAIATTCVAGCLKVVVLNPNEFVERFTDKEYVNSLYLDIKEYAHDACDEASIPYDSVDSSITYEVVFDINEAYVCGNIGEDERFTGSTYQDKLGEFNENLIAQTTEVIADNGITISNTLPVDGIDKFSEKITNYFTESIEFVYLSRLQTITNLGKVGLLALIIVSVIFIVIFSIITYFNGNKKYRALRSISYSFIASGMLNFIFVLGVGIVKLTKTLVIYPTYLCDLAMKYVADCVNCFVEAGVICFIIAIVLSTVVWKFKRDEK